MWFIAPALGWQQNRRSSHGNKHASAEKDDEMIDEKDVAYIIKMLDIGFAVLHHFKCCTVDKWMILQYDNMRKNIRFLLSIKIFSSQK